MGMVVVLDKIQYYENKTSVGFRVEDVEEDGHVTYSFMFQGHLIDEHYALQEDAKFQMRNATNPGYHIKVFGVVHSQQEARSRLYAKALNQANEIATKSGQTLNNKVSSGIQTSTHEPSLLKHMVAFTGAESEH